MTELDDWMALGGLMERFALRFRLRTDEVGEFRAGLALMARMRVELAARPGLADAGVDRAVGAVVDAIRGRPSPVVTRREPLDGHRYVVFSDHHRAFPAHRHDLFGRSGNQALYCRVLAHYLDADYTLVEDGDAEELLILEPDTEPGLLSRLAGLPIEDVLAERRQARARALRRILYDPANAELQRAIGAFHARGRLIRVVGNHDRDFAEPELLEILREVFPGHAPPCELLLLDRAGAPTAAWAILHGHQFDHTTNPSVAPFHGETDTSCLDTFLQGGDREWRWAADGPLAWVSGVRPVRDVLASDVGVAEPPDRTDVADLTALVDQLTALERGDAAGPLVLDPSQWPAERFERLLGYRVAWDQLSTRDPLWAVLSEVWTGRRFFKFRHLDEVGQVRARWQAAFGDGPDGPGLVLGHSHEVRFSARAASGGAPWSGYVNAGSAGRFENLIWGVEIDEDDVRLISWSFAGYPAPGGAPTRTEWAPRDGEDGRVLVPARG